MILGVIPARGGSKGVLRKNLRLLQGIPLVTHAIRRALAATSLCDVVVSTDDPVIAEVARQEKAAVPFLRPGELATDTISVWPAVRHAVGYWEAGRGARLEAVAVLQPTSPLRTAGDIDACIVRFREVEADICATAVLSHDSPYFNMLESDVGPFARPCSAIMQDHVRRQDAPRVYVLNGAVYVVRRTVLDMLENQFAFERFALSEMPRARSVDIDSEEDLELAEWLLSRHDPTVSARHSP